MRLEVLGAAQRTAAMGVWRLLEDELSHTRLTSSLIWTQTWLKHYGSQIPHHFLVGYQGSSPVAICLITESRQPQFGPLTIRTLHVGTAGEADADSVCVEFNTLLVRFEDHAEFVTLIQRHLADYSRCDAISWDGFDLAELPAEMLNGPQWRTIIKPSFYFDLRRVRAEGAEPITHLGDSTRKTIRQNHRDLGTVEVDWSETPRQAEEYFAELVALHQSRWQALGEAGSFASRPFREFHLDLLHQLVPQGRAAMVRVRTGGKTLGCTLLHIDQNRALVYQCGWTTETAAKSPGVIKDYCSLSECLRRGFDAYDFMAGDSIHKRRMTTDQGQLVWASCQLTPWKFETVERLRAAKHWLRTLWPRTEAAS